MLNSEPWIAPRLWPGAECFILGGGPGIMGLDLSRLAGRRVIAVNNAYELGDWPVMLFGDCAWWKSMRNAGGIGHKRALMQWGGLKVHPCKDGCNIPGVQIIHRRNHPLGILTSADRVAWNLSSGACAINLAVHFGVSRIILLGFDMRKIGGEHNWHQEHGHRGPNFNPYENHLRAFPAIAAGLQRLGIECMNATPGSAITEFPVIEPEAVL